MVSALVALAVGYLLGSFPSAYLLAKLKGENIFKVGSGNMGAMNTARNLGYGLGAMVLLLDVGKGALASYVGLTFSSETLLPALLAGIGAVAGHAWPVFLGFRGGGKALATTLGTTLPLYPLVGLLGLTLMIVLTLVSKRSTLAAVVTVVLYPAIVYAVSSLQYGPRGQLGLVLFCTGVVALIVVVRHVPSLRQEFGQA